MYTYSRQSIDENDVKTVLEVLTSDFLTQGPRLKNLSTQSRVILEVHLHLYELCYFSIAYSSFGPECQ